VTKKNRIHLVCNSHIDPVWLWEWEEGAAATLATFRTAAALCDEFDGFVFNHNEAILYEWVEEYEPALFEKIARLVGQGRWHIMGGWYLQPDCNMPSAESFIRQIVLGKLYFKEKFGVEPSTGINLDPFGHSRGLVQILAKSGYDSYLFCRPAQGDIPLEAPRFVWEGYDSSAICATLATAHYNSPLGAARQKVEEWIAAHGASPCTALLWGVGNHGGGPSRKDLADLRDLMNEADSVEIKHSTPENYFDDLAATTRDLPRHAGGLNPWAVGCYTSMSRVKEQHRALENGLFMAEKMAATAAFQGLIDWPRAALRDAARDLATSEFHDSLPGSAIEPVEEGVVRTLAHGLEITRRIRARAFFALAAGQRPAAEGEMPILVYNPHPYPVETTVECELQEAEPHRTGAFHWPRVRQRRRSLPAQPEKAECNINEDHRKRVVFRARLEPSCMNRFDCRLEPLARKPAPTVVNKKGNVRVKTDDLDVIVNGRTGLVDRYRIGKFDYLAAGAFRPLVMKDNADPWGMTVLAFRRRAGAFRLMSRAAGSRFSGLRGTTIPSVRVIEDGPVRTVVEAVFAFGASFLRQRYKLPKSGTEIEIETRVTWNEKDRMLKLSIPTRLGKARYVGQDAGGVAELKTDGDEVVAQKWTALVSDSADRALTCINDSVHGSDAARGEMRLSLLRSPAHAGHPVDAPPARARTKDLAIPIVQQDRHTPRIDQGERIFRFWINAGPKGDRLTRIDREALVHNEKPFALSVFPSGDGSLPARGVVLSDRAVQVLAVKKAERGKDLIVRLFEPTGRKRSTTITMPFLETKARVALGPFEIKTLRVNLRTGGVSHVDLLERPLKEIKP